jgi:subtilisin family serine protease
MSRRIPLLCLTAVLVLGLNTAGAAAAPASSSTTTTTTPTPAPTSPTTTPPSTPGHVRAAAQPVPGQYIVTLKSTTSSSVPATAADLAARHGGTVFHVYEHALRGFAVRMTASQATALSDEPAVASVEQDSVVHATASPQPNVDNIGALGLDRIDQHAQPLDNLYHYGADGSGVHAYILDTGIANVSDFGSRASFGADCVLSVMDNCQTSGTLSDCHGHGTHVAGILGGSSYGVAKSVSLVERTDRGTLWRGAGTPTTVVAAGTS